MCRTTYSCTKDIYWRGPLVVASPVLVLYVLNVKLQFYLLPVFTNCSFLSCHCFIYMTPKQIVQNTFRKMLKFK